MFSSANISDAQPLYAPPTRAGVFLSLQLNGLGSNGWRLVLSWDSATTMSLRSFTVLIALLKSSSDSLTVACFFCWAFFADAGFWRGAFMLTFTTLAGFLSRAGFLSEAGTCAVFSRFAGGCASEQQLKQPPAQG